MAIIKNIFNSTALEAALFLLRRSLAFEIDPTQVGATVSSLSGTSARVDIVTRQLPPGSGANEFSGSTSFEYSKTDLDLIIPQNLVFGGAYPTTFETLKTYCLDFYELLLEDNEFYLEGDVSTTPLAGSSTINITPDGTNRIALIANDQSGRWISGGTIRFKLTGTVG